MQFALQLAWLIPLAPLLSFGVIVFFSRQLGNRGSSATAISAVGLSFALSCLISLPVIFGHVPTVDAYGHYWIREVVIANIGVFDLRVGLQVDNLTAIMLMVVSLVSLLVHVFSTSYMHEEDRYPRYFAYLGIFTAAMMGLVLADNVLLMFVSWEIMGLASYLLIGFFFTKPAAASASLKAFMTTRVGDVGMFVGLVALFGYTMKFAGGLGGATLQFDEIYTILLAHQSEIGAGALAFMTIMLFMGAVGKSAQFPLHVWLPDAMEGPTPVSALIHAATMVAAGIYLLARMFPIFQMSETGMLIVALTGGFTALFAATIGLVQYDIKKVLAYSTVSQLGYMAMAIGCGGLTAGIFHLMTHAYFKGLMFLGSGSVIQGCHHEQDMRHMGGLKKKMPITFWTFWAGCMAISGIFPFAGFFSKDEILVYANHYFATGGILHKLPLIFGMVAAGLTPFYMFRLLLMTFSGEYRGHAHPKENPAAITVPLMILGTLALCAGWLGWPDGLFGITLGNRVHHLVNAEAALAPYQAHEAAAGAHEFAAPHGEAAGGHETASAHGAATHGEEAATPHAEGHGEAEGPNYVMIFLSTGIALTGVLLAYLIYYWRVIPAAAIRKLAGPIHPLLLNKYYIDELYAFFYSKLGKILIHALAQFDKLIIDGVVNLAGHCGVGLAIASGQIDKWIVDGMVNLAGYIAAWTGRLARLLQTGYVQNYAMVVLVGILLILTLATL